MASCLQSGAHGMSYTRINACMIDFEIPVVYGAGLLTAAALLLAALVALCFSLHRGGAFADTPRAAARAIRQFSFTPRGVQSPRAYFAGTPRQRHGF